MRIITGQNTYLTLTDEDGNIRNEMIFVVARSGWGKGLTAEGFVEEFQKAGYVVIVIADPKNEVEYGYAQFLPKEQYHLKALRREGKKPEAKKIKIYHPFTFRIPYKKIPDYNFYTFNIKDLGQKEWSLIAETPVETETIRLLHKACEDISRSDGIYGFLHYIQDIVRGKKDERHTKPDPRNFYLSITSGTAKSIQDISNYIQPFKKDYFLTSEDCRLNIDWKKILRDQEHYHVFVSNFIPRKEDKIKSFIVMTLFNQILENKDLATKPILIVIPEIRYLVPFKPKGYKVFLADTIKENLSVMRSMGRGMTALLDTQVFSGVDEEVSNSSTITFLGELGGARDIDKISKAMNYKRTTREMLAKMDKPNSYLIQGMEDLGSITTWFPRHRHCEPNYNFQDTCEKECPEKLKDYSKLIEEMKKKLKEDEFAIREKIKKQEQREKERRAEIRKLKEEARRETAKIQQKSDKLQDVQDKTKIKLMSLIYEFKKANPKATWRTIGKEFDIHHRTASKYYDYYVNDLKIKHLEELNKEENPEPLEIPDESEEILPEEEEDLNNIESSDEDGI